LLLPPRTHRNELPMVHFSVIRGLCSTNLKRALTYGRVLLIEGLPTTGKEADLVAGFDRYGAITV